jgi:G3E family GTPase
VTADRGAVDAAVLFPPRFFDPDATASEPALRRSGLFAEDPGHPGRYASVSLVAEFPLDWRSFESWLRGIRLRHAEALLRVKGMLNIPHVEGPVIVQGVHHVIDAPVTLDAWPSADRRSRLVLIGDHATIASAQESWVEALPGLLAHR